MRECVHRKLMLTVRDLCQDLVGRGVVGTDLSIESSQNVNVNR